jgi:hypothetical protein
MKKDDPRKMPLNQCASLGDLMFHLQQCKELDKKDQEDQQKEYHLTEDDMEIE